MGHLNRVGGNGDYILLARNWQSSINICTHTIIPYKYKEQQITERDHVHDLHVT